MFYNFKVFSPSNWTLNKQHPFRSHRRYNKYWQYINHREYKFNTYVKNWYEIQRVIDTHLFKLNKPIFVSNFLINKTVKVRQLNTVHIKIFLHQLNWFTSNKLLALLYRDLLNAKGKMIYLLHKEVEIFHWFSNKKWAKEALAQRL